MEDLSQLEVASMHWEIIQILNKIYQQFAKCLSWRQNISQKLLLDGLDSK